MSDLYTNIKNACTNKGMSVSAMCLNLGMSKSTMSDLKAGRKKSLSTETLSKIADFLDVSIDYLLGNEQKEKPLVNEDEELTEYLDLLRNRPEMKMMFQLAKGATKEDVEKAVKIIELFLGKKDDE